MVPAEVVARREACNLAYLPVGSLEWHGAHMPFGTDYFTVAHIAEEAARHLGGVVFPPIFYHDTRYWLQECRVEWRNTYVRDMAIPRAFAEAFPLENAAGEPEFGAPLTRPDDGPLPEDVLPFTIEEQMRSFSRHIARVLLEIHLYGFRNILLLPGHGPNPPQCRQAEEIYRQNVARRTAFGPPARTLTYFYIDGVDSWEPLLKGHWLHADRWEGSVTMVAAPGTVHPELLPGDPQVIPPAYLGFPFLSETEGYRSNAPEDVAFFRHFDPRNGTSEEYGREQLRRILERLSTEVERWMAEGQ